MIKGTRAFFKELSFLESWIRTAAADDDDKSHLPWGINLGIFGNSVFENFRQIDFFELFSFDLFPYVRTPCGRDGAFGCVTARRADSET